LVISLPTFFKAGDRLESTPDISREYWGSGLALAFDKGRAFKGASKGLCG